MTETWIDQHGQRVCDAADSSARIATLESQLADATHRANREQALRLEAERKSGANKRILEGELEAEKAKLAEAERTIGQLRHRIGEIEDERGATIAELRKELDLRKDYADQVRAQSTTIVRLGREIEAADRERDWARRVAVWAADEGQAAVCGHRLEFIVTFVAGAGVGVILNNIIRYIFDNA